MEEVKAVADRRQPFIAVYGDIGIMKKIALACEQKLVMEVEGCAKAVTALVGLYFVLNYEYSPHVAKVLEFLQHFFVKIASPADISHSVRELALYMQFH